MKRLMPMLKSDIIMNVAHKLHYISIILVLHYT